MITLAIPFEFWRNFPIITAAIGQTLFVIFYSIRPLGAGQWWKDPVGRALFIKSFTLGLLLDTLVLAYISRFLHHGWSYLSFHITIYDGKIDYYIVVGFWITLFGVYYQLVVLLKNRFFTRR